MPITPTPLDFKLTWRSFLDSEVAAVPGLEIEDGTLLPPPPTLPLTLAPPRLDLLPRLSGLLGPTEEEEEEAAAAAEREDAIDRSSRVDENPASGDNGAIALEGMVDRRFFPSRTSGPPFFLVGIVLVLFSSMLPLFLFSSVRPPPAVASTPPATMPASFPRPRRPPRAAMLLEILPDKEEEEEEERWDATAGPTTDADGMELLLLPPPLPPPLLDLDATPTDDRLLEKTEADKSLVSLIALPASSPPEG